MPECPIQTEGLLSGTGVSEALVAIHRPVTPWYKGDFTLCTAGGAHGLVHLSRPLIRAAITPFAPDLAAFRAPSGLVDQPPGLVEFLLTSGEHKFPPTIPTHQGLVCKCHRNPHSKLCPFTPGHPHHRHSLKSATKERQISLFKSGSKAISAFSGCGSPGYPDLRQFPRR